jgi:phosphate acetyltransferase
MVTSFKEILAAAKLNGPKKLVIPSPSATDISLLAAASSAGLIIPILVGAGSSLAALVGGSPLAVEKYELGEENDPGRIMRRAVAIVRDGRGDILMQGGAAPPGSFSRLSVTRSKGYCPKAGSQAMFPSFLS